MWSEPLQVSAKCRAGDFARCISVRAFPFDGDEFAKNGSCRRASFAILDRTEPMGIVPDTVIRDADKSSGHWTAVCSASPCST